MTQQKQTKEREKQQSNNWESRKDKEGRKIEGYPFNEGFPSGGPFGTINKKYEIILANGLKYEATPEYSRQYVAEGIQWELIDSKRLIERDFVAGWREI